MFWGNISPAFSAGAALHYMSYRDGVRARCDAPSCLFPRAHKHHLSYSLKVKDKPMKKWKCSVCGYIHKGDEPPDQCPVCGADKSLFTLLEEPEVTDSRHATAQSGVAPDNRPGLKMRCTVCSYIHHGSAPPDQCPVCRADGSKFASFNEAIPEPPPTAEQESKEATRKKKIEPRQDLPQTTLNRLAASKYGQLLTRLHGHPVAVHIPNGVLPMTFIFILLAALFKSSALATVAQYNMGFVALSMPLVIGTGLIDWVNGFKGKMTRVFRTKMICAGIVTLLSIVLVVWGILRPGIYNQPLATSWFFLLLHLVNLIAAIVAGWQGGKLVFKK
jgi:rubredoxin/uncharacterized membrane protein